MLVTLLTGSAQASEVREISSDNLITKNLPVEASPFTLDGEELSIRESGTSPGRATPGGVVWVEDSLPIQDSDVRVRVRLRVEDSQGTIGLSLVSPEHGWYLAALAADGFNLRRSVGSWTSIEHRGIFSPTIREWFWLEIELGRDGADRRWSVTAWPDGTDRPNEPSIIAHERLTDVIAGLSPAVWSQGLANGTAADLEVQTLITSNPNANIDGWPVDVSGDRVEFSDSRIDGSRLSFADIDQKHVAAQPTLNQTQLKTLSSFPCNPYANRFVGAAPLFGGSTAILGLPGVDHDCDGEFNEDWIDGLDNDGDGLVDEDPGQCADWLLNWSSDDTKHGSVSSGDTTAMILIIRRIWPSFKESMIFATVFGGPDYALAGAVRTKPDPAGFAELIGSNGFVTYLLVAAASEPLEIEVLESGVPLADGQVFGRAVTFSVDITGGTPPTSATATIDDAPYTMGEPFDIDGSHTIRVQASDTAGEVVTIERAFSIDTTPPAFDGVVPVTGSILGATPVIVTGLVSADTTTLTIGGANATLDPPSGPTRGFSSQPVALAEGLNTIDLVATDAFGHTGVFQLTLTLDTLAPEVTIVTPPDGTFTTVGPITVTGNVVETNLAGLTVNGVAATITGSQFTAEVGLIEGGNTITAEATDVLGRTGSATVNVVLDTTAPGVFITVPTSGFVTDASTITVSGIFDEPLSSVTVNGLATTFGNESFAVDEIPLAAEGDNFITATATDLAGNTADSPPVLVVLDTLPPTVGMNTAGLPTLTANAALTVTGAAADPHLASVTVAGQPATIAGDQWTVDLVLSEGDNELVAIAEDTLGHTSSTAPFTVTLDSRPPVVTIMSPVAGAEFSSATITVEGAVDDLHLDTTSVTVNGLPSAVSAGAFSLEIELSEGDSTLVAQASDTLGQIGASEPVAVTVDTLPPVVTLAVPLGTLVATPTVDVTGTVAEPHLDLVTVNGIVATVTGSQFMVSEVQLIEGSNLLLATATDTFGHSADSNQIEYVLDTTPPSITILSPLDGDLIAADTVNVSGSVTDVHLWSVTVNGVDATIDGETFTAEGVPLAEGVSVLTAFAEDLLDFTASSSISVVSDTSAPGVAIIEPTVGACLPAGQPISVSGSVFDANLSDGLGGNPPPLVLEVVTTDGATLSYPAVVAADGRSWSVEGVDLGSADGTAILTATAIDAIGRTGVAAGSVRVDATPPALTLLLDGSSFSGASAGPTPPPGAVPVLLNRAAGFRVSVADGAFGAPQATLTLNGLAYVPGSPVEIEGDHLVVATATDCAGHTASVHALFTIDLTAPALVDTIPADVAQLTEGPGAYSGTADAELATATVNGAPAVVTGAAFSLSPITWREGENTVEVVLIDPAGNQATFNRSFTVSTIEPTVTIVDGGLPIPNNAVYTRAVTPEVRATPADATIAITLDGAPFALGTTIDSTGEYTLEATATDSFGRTATATVSFRVDLDAGPTIAITTPVDGATLTEALVTVNGTVTGNEPTVHVNGMQAVVTGDTWSVVDLSLDPDVLNLITAIATDSAGRTATATVSVMVMTGGGQVLILEPVDGASTIRDLIDVVGVVIGGADRTADGAVTVNGIVTPVALDGGFRTLDVPLVSGANAITADVTDPEGRTGMDTITVHSDLSPPVIALSADGAPLDEGAVFSSSVTITVTISDDVGTPPAPIITLNGNTQPADGAVTDVPVTVDGGYLLAVTALDAAGNERRAERSFTITGGGCGLTDLSPPDGVSVTEAAVTIRGRSGSAELVKVRVPIPDTSPVQYTEYTADLADGTFVAGGVSLPAIGDNVLEIECEGADSSSAVETLTIHRLPEGDGPVVALVSPVEGALTVERTIPVSGTVSDPAATVTVNARSAVVTEEPDGSGAFVVDLPLTEGPNVLSARAVDAAGRAGTDRTIVWLDTRALPVTITSPENNSWHGPRGDGAAVIDVSGLVDINSEPHLDTVTVTTAVGSVTAIVNSDTGAFLASGVPVDAAADPTAAQAVTVTAADTLGHVETAEIDVHFDATGPAIVITTPPDLERYSESSPADISATGEAWAAEGASVSINGATIDPTTLTWDGPVADGRFHTSFSIDLPRPSDEGPFAVIARVSQLDGRWAGTRRLLFVDVTAPEVVETHPGAGSEGVDTDSLMLVLFSEPILHSSLSESDGISLTRLDTTEPVVGHFAVSGDAVAFVPAVALTGGIDYRLSVGAGVTDLVGHPIAQGHDVDFATAAQAASSAPQLDPVDPVICASSLTISGAATPNTTVRVRDGDLSFSGASDPTGAFTIELPLTGNGYHVLEVAAVDRTGVEGPTATVVVRVDCGGPRIERAAIDLVGSLITIEFSEPIDPASASFGFSGAAIRLFDDNDPAAGDQDATLQISADGTGIELLLDSAPDAWWRDTVIRLIVGPPLADENGNEMGAPFETLLFPTGGGIAGGFLFGEVYDDTTGRPLQGATAGLYLAGSALPGAVPAGTEDPPLAMATTDSRGRYQILDEVTTGRYTLVLEADDHVRVVRQLALEPATGTVPFDSRLTPAGDEAGTLDPVAGGTIADQIQPLLQLFANPNGVPVSGDLTVHLVPRSGQGLADALPLGWTPLASADVVLTDTGGNVLADGQNTAFADDSVYLDLPLPDWVLPTDTLVAVRYHLAGGQWLTLADLELIDGPNDEPIARVELVGPGSVAVVLPDGGDGAPPLPATGAGNPLRGVSLPDVLPEFTATLALDLPSIPPTASAVASVVALSADGLTPWPSGLAVQAYLEERLILAGGVEQLIEAPFVADLLLYRSRLDSGQLGGNTPESAGAVDFVVSPSERAAQVLLDVGYENIRIYPFPGQLERGQILGPGGGTVTSADGVELSVPEGALPSKTVVQANLLTPDELAALPAIIGYDTIAAVRVELGGHTLVRAATLSLDVPAGAPDAIPGDPRLILTELIEAPADGRGAYPELTARIDRAAGRLTAAPEAPDSGLAVNGVSREGLYLVLHAQAPMAYATGLVTAANGFGIELARVTSDGLGTADLSALGGRYAVPIQAQPGTIVEAAHPASDESGSAVVAAVSPGEIIALDIAIVPVSPTVVDVFPQQVDQPVNVTVYIDFSESLNPATVGPGTVILALADAAGRPTATRVAGTVELVNGDSRITFEPSYPLAPGRTWVAIFSGGVTDAGGTPYRDGPVEWTFTTSTVVAPGGQVHPELFRIRMPIDGVAEIYGEPGALPIVTQGVPWSVSPFVVRTANDPERDTFSADTVGGFSGFVGHPPDYPVTIEDEVWVEVFDHNLIRAARFRLDVFSSPDGRGFVAPVGQAVSFTTADGIAVEVPEGAFDRATAVTVTPLDPTTAGVEDDLGLGLGGYIDVDFDGAAADTLVLKVPAPDDIAPNAKVLIGEPVNLAWGRRIRLTGVGGILEEDGASYLSNDESVQPPIPDLTQGNLKLGGDTDVFLGLQEAGSSVWYYEVDPLYGGDLIAFATFISDNQDSMLWGIFASAQADMWVFQAPPENWSGQVVLPMVPGTEFTVEHRDAATGWLLSSQTYGSPDDVDGDGIIPLEAFLEPDPGPPLLIDASPFHVIRFSATEPDTTERLRLDLEARVQSSGGVSLEYPEGFEMDDNAGLAFYGVSDPTKFTVLGGPAFADSEGLTGVPKNVGEEGADLMVVVGPSALVAESFSAFSLTFSRAITGKLGETPVSDIAVLTDRGSIDSDSSATPNRVSLAVETRANDRSLLIRPLSNLSAGHQYELELKAPALFPGACAGASKDTPCAAPWYFHFTTSGGNSDPVAAGGDALTDVRTIAKIGNLLFAGTLSGRITATDLAGGSSPTPGTHTPHSEMEQGPATQVRAFATDGHGRLFFNAQINGIAWQIKSIAVEDVIATSPGGRFAPKSGEVRIAYAIGSDFGSIGEFLAGAAMPLATPVDLDVLVRDKTGEIMGLAEFCTANECSGYEDPPDAQGFFSISLSPGALPNRPNPIPRESQCADQSEIDKFQRISLDNLTTGQTWSVDLLTSEGSGPPLTFKARRGDQLRLRYNLQTLGFVALIGSGVTVVDLNRMYDTPLAASTLGFSQCGRRLGKYEGVETDLQDCDLSIYQNPDPENPPVPLRYGIDMTTSVETLGPIACEGEDCPVGFIHLYSPLMSTGLINSQAPQDNPGSVSEGELTCTKLAGLGSLPPPPTRVFLRDVAIAHNVQWIDRGIRSSGPGMKPEFYIDQALDRFNSPERLTSDLLFMSLGEEGVYVFDVGPDVLEGAPPLLLPREPKLIGKLMADGHSAYRVQVEQDLGILLAGGIGGQLNVWDLHNINIAPLDDISGETEGLPEPRPLLTLDNVPWITNDLAVDRTGTGLIYAWGGDSNSAIAIPLRAPTPIVAGVYRGEGDPPSNDDPTPRELRPTAVLVPLGIPTELTYKLETDEESRAENDRRYAAAFKVRIALPGYLGDTVDAKIESLLIRPPDAQMGKADLGPAKAPPGGPGWPDPEEEVTLKRLAGVDGTMNGRFGQAFNLYESEEIILLLADPRAAEDYTPQGHNEDPEQIDIASESGQCRRCDRPEFLTEDDTVLEMLAAGPYLRVILDLENSPEIAAFFGPDHPVPASIVELAGWADDVPSPVQVSLAEPPLGAAGWSPGEGGVAASLVSGESLYSMTDHATRGRALGFAFERSYRSGLLSYNSLGSAGWTANVFAHLRENPLTGEVAYHDGAGHVWRFFPPNPVPHVDQEARTQPAGDQPGDFWSVENRHHITADPQNSYLTPKGLYLILRKMDGGSSWELVGPHNDTMKFDGSGRLVEIADRLRGTATEDEIRGNRVKLFYDPFGRLEKVVDDYGRPYLFRYHEDADDDATFGLLKEIEDFGDRKVQYRYTDDDSRFLEQVEPPNLRDESLAPGVTGTRYVSYTYDGTNFGEDVMLHDDLAGRRLNEVFLPGRTAGTEPRVKLDYKSENGRLERINPAGVDLDWFIVFTDYADTGRIGLADITTPWSGRLSYFIHHEGIDRGRVEKVGILAEAVDSDWEPSALVPAEPPPDNAILRFTGYEEYEPDGSGRIKKISYPDLSSVSYGYCSVGRIGSFGVETILRRDSLGDHLLTTMPCIGRVDNLPGVVLDGLSRTTKITPLSVVNPNTPTTTVNRGFTSSDGNVLRDAIYHPTGQVDSIEIGVVGPDSGTPGLETLSFEYHDGLPTSDGGKGYMKRVRRGDGPEIDITVHDAYGNPRIIEQSASEGKTVTRREFDEWDQPYEVFLAEGGGPGVGQKITTKHDLRGRVAETTRTQQGVGLITSNINYTERGQVDDVTSGGHAGSTPSNGVNASQSITIDYQYVGASGLLQHVVSEQHTTTLVHDSAGRVTTVQLPKVSPEGGPIELHRGYDSMGRVVYVTDGHDGWWRGKFNGLGQLKEESFSDGTTVTRGYDGAGGLEEIHVEGADGTNFTQRFNVANFGAVTKMWEPGLSAGERLTEFNFDAAGRLKKLKRGPEDGELRTELSIDYYEDGSGRVHKVTDVFGNSMSYGSFGSDGRSPWPETITSHQLAQAGPDSVVTLSLDYDGLGRAHRVASSDGRTITRNFDEVGNLLNQTINGEHGRTVKYNWDGWGRITAMQRPDLGASSGTLYGYDLDGNLVNKTVQRGGASNDITTYDHWGIGLLKQRTLPGSTTPELFEYYSDGTLASWATRQLNEAGQPLKIAYDYDSSNRLTKRFVKDAAAYTAGGLQDGMAGLSEVGDRFDYDGLGRIKTFGRLIDPVSNTLQDGSKVSFEYHLGDPRPYPTSETIEKWSSWMPGSGGINRAWDIFDRLDSISGPTAQFGLQDIHHDALNRRIEVTTDHGDRFHGTYTWAGTGRLFGLSAGNLEQNYAYLEVGEPPEDAIPGELLSTLTANYGEPEAFGELSALGSFDYRWIEGQIKAGRDVLDPGFVFSDMGWGWTVDASHRLIAASAGHTPCDENGECPDATRSWAWPNMGPADEMKNWTDHLGTLTTVNEHGANGRMVEIEREGPIGPANETLGYDLMGRRITDGLHDILWSWRGELVEVKITDIDPSPFVVTYAYDAKGRLLERTKLLWNEASEEYDNFHSGVGFLWNDWELLAQIGLNYSGEPIWRIEHLPGPVGLDDSPQLAVTTHLDLTEPVTRYFDLVRDEMGTVIAVLEDVDPTASGATVPPLLARILYDPYGQAHVEEGPELRTLQHDPELTEIDGVAQAILDEGEPDNPVIGIAGGLVVSTSMALDEATLAAGVTLMRCDPGCVALGPAEVVVVQDESDATLLYIMPVAGWLENLTYNLELNNGLADAYGRAFIVPGGGGGYTVDIAISADSVEATDDPLPSLPREIPLIFDNVDAASVTLDCDGEPCFPGGLNLLFQGLWTDPVTGISYARNRWYDARTASWLSEDPLGAVDSPNLYAFVGWGPHAARDPMGRNLVDPAYTLNQDDPHYLFDGTIYRVSPSGMVWEQVVEDGLFGHQGYRAVLDRGTTDVVLAMAGRSSTTDLRKQQMYITLSAELSEEERAQVTADVFCALPGSSDLCDAHVIATGRVPFTGEYVGPLEYSATTGLALLPFIAGHTLARMADTADDISDFSPGTAGHKAQRWLEYQDRGGEWGYDRWSKVYGLNMTRARQANRAVDGYWGQVGWGTREVTVDVGPGITRRLDIADKGLQKGIEHKSGRQFATKSNLWEIARDRELRTQGWDIRWHIDGRPSAPLLRALDEAGIPHNMGD